MLSAEQVFKALFIYGMCMMVIGISPLWIAMLLNVDNAFGGLVVILSIVFTFPLGVYVALKLGDRFVVE